MRIFVAGLMTETSSFSAVPTSLESFEKVMFFRPRELTPQPEPAAYDLIGYGAFVRRARERGYAAYTSLHAFAEPGAPSAQADYEALRDEILRDLQGAMPLDMVTLMLKGADNGDMIDFEGSALQLPGVGFKATLTRIAD